MIIEGDSILIEQDNLKFNENETITTIKIDKKDKKKEK